MSIYVGNLSFEVTQDDLTSTFAEYGTVKLVKLPTDRKTGRMRGFAFVEMGSDSEEDKAITELNGAEWMGRNLKVNKAKLARTIAAATASAAADSGIKLELSEPV
jgi:RNA recognition motif-containing protein